MGERQKIAIAVTGASGSIYAKILFDKLVHIPAQLEEVAIVFSKNAQDIWKFELGNEDYKHLPFSHYSPDDFYSPLASGSSGFDTMIVCPCSMGTLGRIAHGVSDDLISRAADVMLKERKKLILVTRETPLNLIHVENMLTITRAGGIICPASPSFYSKPLTVEQLTETIVDRVLQLAGFSIRTFRWGEKT